jgi:hypothetical protein
MKRLHWTSAGFLLALSVVSGGCRSPAPITDPLTGVPRAAIEPESPAGSARLQRNLVAEARNIQSGLVSLARTGGWRKRGYFSAAEHDAIEGLLFRFVVMHSALWGEFDRWGGLQQAQVQEIDRPRAHTLVMHAGWSLAASSAGLVALFQEDPVAIAKLNEAFYRSEIPRGSYDALRLAVTSGRLDALRAAWRLQERAMQEPGSFLAELATSDPAFAGLLAEIPGLHDQAIASVRRVAKNQNDTGAKNALDHSRAAALKREATESLGDAGYATRALLFKDVSRIKSPRARLIVFSPDQKRQIHAALEPGDVILTYTAGYVSSVFIPGEFKHGITYVGSASDRAAAGLSDASLPAVASAESSRFASNLARQTTVDGSPADLIEAVAEGVKFSNLDQILDTHINRLVVLRPRIDARERSEFLAGVFAYVGDPYDFRFDFADASMQVCTEVIYRALNGKGGIRFELTTRAGHPTLSADDVVNYHLETAGDHFDFLLYAEEDPDAGDHRARVLAGEPGARRLQALMATP